MFEYHLFEYHQGTGQLWRYLTLGLGAGSLFASGGYSGSGEGKNNPAFQQVHNVGPIPQGLWRIASLTEGPTAHGPYVLHLAPCEGTNTFGRDGFLIHGDSLAFPGTASQGCIIFPRHVRESIWSSGDRSLRVIA